MFDRWRGGKAKGERAGPAVADDLRLYAVGDIHGRLDLLRELEEHIAADAARHPSARRRIVYLGDYVDRGLDSKGVNDTLLAPRGDGIERICLKGNHEDLMLRFLDDPDMGPSWFFNGGLATLFSYGVGTRAEGGDPLPHALVADRLRGRLPKGHLHFLRNLQLTHREGDYLFVHAGLRPGRPLDDQDEEDLLWIREPFTRSQSDHGCVVVHGHTIEPDPVEAGNRIGIDTGAYASGVLTCLVLQGSSRGFLRTGG